ncbi:MAG: GNAT family N-acetyltransferase [Fimbriimonadaceae bacterium]|nr:GNAT family N-acetyltransferase [Fimbriimonadaceae bacterium]
MLAVRVVETADWIDRLVPQWSRLHVEAGGTSFQSPDWLAAWWDVFGGGRRPRVLTAYEGDDLVGLFPLCVGGSVFRRLAPMGAGPSDTLAPLIHPERQTPVAEAFAKEIVGLSGVDEVVLPELPESSPLASRLTGGSPRSVCLKLDLPSTFDGYVKTLSKSLRYDVRRLDKRADRFRIEFAGASDAHEALESFLNLHGRRWRKRGLPGAFFGRTVRFQRAFAPAAIASGRLWLARVWIDGSLAGALYALRSGTNVGFYQSGFEPRLSALSPGTLLVAATIRRAIEEGCTVFDFLRGDEPYKRRWSPQRAEANLRFACPGPGLRGRLSHALGERGHAVEEAVKRRFEGRGLLR